ncbi:MAG: hypothetical protein ACOYK6_04190 [Chthoniobacterales bacterium]
MSTSSVSSSSSSAYSTPPPHPAEHASSTNASNDHSESSVASNTAIPGQAPLTEVSASQDPTTQAGYLSQIVEGDQGSSQILQKELGTSLAPTPSQQGLQGATSLGEKTAPLSLSEGGIIVEVATSSNTTSSGSKVVVGAPTIFQKFKNTNGAPKISDTSRKQSGLASKTTAFPYGRSKNENPLGSSSTTDTSSSSSGFNVLEEIELAGALNQKIQNENDLGAVAAHQLEQQNDQNKINEKQHKINLNIQAQRARPGSPVKTGGPFPLFTDAINFINSLFIPERAATPATITTSLTGPNGKTMRSTTITATPTSDGSTAYTRTTTGARGQTTDISGNVTKNSNTEISNGSIIINNEYTKTYTGTRTTARGRTIDEGGISIYDKEKVIDIGLGTTGQGKSDHSSTTSRTFDGARVYSDPNNDHRTKVKKIEKQDDRTSINDAEIEAAEAIQDAMQALSNLNRHDRDVIIKYMSILTIATLSQ